MPLTPYPPILPSDSRTNNRVFRSFEKHTRQQTTALLPLKRLANVNKTMKNQSTRPLSLRERVGVRVVHSIHENPPLRRRPHRRRKLLPNRPPKTGLSTRLQDFLDTFDELVDCAIESKVDLALFCGDAYRSRDPSQTHQREFAKRIVRLSEAGIPSFLLIGNHDTPHVQGPSDSARNLPHPGPAQGHYRRRRCDLPDRDPLRSCPDRRRPLGTPQPVHGQGRHASAQRRGGHR